MLAKGKRPASEIMELIWFLPEEGAFAKALGGPQYGWNEDRVMLMHAVNELIILNYSTLKLAGQKNVKKPKLLEVPKPEALTPTEDSLAIEARKMEEWLSEE